MMIVSIILLGFILILTISYINGKYNENYWRKRGVPFHTRNKVMGPIWDYLLQKRALFEIIGDIYKQYPTDPAIGIGFFFTPALYVKDLKNIQHVLQSDFYAFNHRGVEINKNDQLGDNLLFMKGARWKAMRQIMTPLFTAAKLKNMYYIMDKIAQDFINYLKVNPQKLKGGVYDTLNMFCSAAICGAVLGIGTKSTFDSPFLKVAREAVNPTFTGNLKFFIANISPALFKLLRLKLFREYEDFFIGSIKQVIRHREQENVKKHDYADICINLQNNGMIKDNDSGLELEPTDELLAAQAFCFFIAGVDPSASAMFCTMIELGKNPDIMRRVHKEIDNVFEKHGGNITYDVLSVMEYLDNVLNEAMRMYPPIGFLKRQCVQDTVLPVGNIKVDKGTKIFMPIFEIHHDSKYYPDPEIFNPDRFDKTINEFNVLAYMPFGKGSRRCIGSRFARLQAKAGLVHLLRHFNVRTLGSESGIQYVKVQFQVRPKNVDVELIPRTEIKQLSN